MTSNKFSAPVSLKPPPVCKPPPPPEPPTPLPRGCLLCSYYYMLSTNEHPWVQSGGTAVLYPVDAETWETDTSDPANTSPFLRFSTLYEGIQGQLEIAINFSIGIGVEFESLQLDVPTTPPFHMEFELHPIVESDWTAWTCHATIQNTD